MRFITRNVWVLSVVSLFTDVATEMLYPVMPVYLSSIGFSVVLIGVLEGCAEATAGLSKGYFGNLSDHQGRRLPFIRAGYGFSGISKPLMIAWINPLWVFFARALDRLGKGIRTGARDALLSDEANERTKAKVFGFHRAMDTLGAVLGPALALLYLAYHPAEYRSLFLIAFIPGVLAIVFTGLIREKRAEPKTGKKPGFFQFARYWKESPAEYRKLAGALLVFTLFNSSDMFLLLRVKDAGYDDTTVIGAYMFYNLMYAALSYPMGALADRLGMKKVFLGGLLVFSCVYAGMAFAEDTYVFMGLFVLYGLFSAATEGVAKAWITNICEKRQAATAIGTYTAFQSVCTLLASSVTGLIWYWAGAIPALLLTSAGSLAVMVFMMTRVKSGYKV